MRFALLCCLWASMAIFGTAQGPIPKCPHCRDKALVPCTKHGRTLALEQQPGVEFCSVAVECKTCLGALQVDCRQCQHPTQEEELAARQQLAQQWLQERRQSIDALTAREPHMHLRTPNFDLAFTLKPATIGTEKPDSHARMHVYGQRLEELRALFVATFELSDADLPQRMLVCMSEDRRDHGVLGPRLTAMGGPDTIGLKLMGPKYIYSMWPEKRTLPDDEAVHRNIVHNVTHLLLSQMQPAMFLGNRKHGWIDEGIAHWFEDKIVGKCTNYCFEEVALLAGAGFKGGKWRPAVRKLVDMGETGTFAALSSRNTDEMTFVEHAIAFAYVDFLLADQGGAKFRDFLRLVKANQPTREAMKQAFGRNLLEIDGDFTTWVKKNYAPLPPR